MLGDVLRWLLAVELMSFVALRVASHAFAGWPDRGYAFAKIFGLLVVGYASWLLAMLGLLDFTGPTIVVLALLIGALGWRLGWGGPAAVPALRVAEEVIFLSVFLGGVVLRSMSPAIAGQEKPMDLMFLHALIRADRLPAEDAWLAGFGLPYYYFGYLQHALAAKVSGVDPAVAYNLAVATVLALGAVGAFGFVANVLLAAGSGLRVGALWGLVATGSLAVMGNLQAFAEVAVNRGLGDRGFWTGLGIKTVGTDAGAEWFPTDGSWWFRAARVIPNIAPDGITEFPFFSLLLADLHPHYMAIPLAVLVLALAAARLTGLPPGRDLPSAVARVLLPGLAIGAVIPTNTWDLPLVAGAYGAAVVAARYRERDTEPSWLLPAALEVAAIMGVAVLAFAPYFVGYVSQPLGLGLVQERTWPGTLLVLFGPLLALPALAGLVVAGGRTPSAPPLAWLGAALGGAGVLLALGQPTLGILAGLVALWLGIAWQRICDRPALPLLTAGLVLLGLGALLVPEIVYLRDVFGTRMNTVFKFYYDAWVILALAGPLLGFELVQLVRHLSAPAVTRATALATLGVSGALGLAGLLYPLGAIPARSHGLPSGPTLDGMALLRAARPDEAAAIDWLRRQASTPRVIEAVGDDYTEAGRFSTFSGSIAPLGWYGHEQQWRGPRAELDARRAQVRDAYTQPFDEQALLAWRALGIEYIVVGALERQLYGSGIEANFASLEPAYQAGNTVLYRVRPGPRS